jgi:hypothetical protein
MSRNRLIALLFCFFPISTGPGWCEENMAQWKQADEHFSIDAIRPQCGWAEERVDPGQWKPAEQPDLAEQLEEAPLLELENVAPLYP